jgi:hypothetical protein
MYTVVFPPSGTPGSKGMSMDVELYLLALGSEVGTKGIQ